MTYPAVPPGGAPPPTTGHLPVAPADPGPAAPPPGPGVTPPFPAPPVEGRTARVWVGVGVGGLGLLLCCGAGVAATVGLVVTGGRAIDEQAQVVVGDYFDAVRAEDYDTAYGLLCEEAQDDETPAEFADRVRDEAPITSYDVGESTIAADVVVPVDVTYRTGRSESLRVYLAQDGGTGQFEVCRVEG